MARLSSKEIADRISLAASSLPDKRAVAAERRAAAKKLLEKVAVASNAMPWVAELRAKAAKVPGCQSNKAGKLARSW